jgi:hypothetical protein
VVGGWEDRDGEIGEVKVGGEKEVMAGEFD